MFMYIAFGFVWILFKVITQFVLLRFVTSYRLYHKQIVFLQGILFSGIFVFEVINPGLNSVISRNVSCNPNL